MSIISLTLAAAPLALRAGGTPDNGEQPNHDSLLYKISSGKPFKGLYFLKNYAKQFIPRAYYRHRLPAILESLDSRPDKDYILQRVNHYCLLENCQSLPDDTIHQHNGSHYVFLDLERNFKPSTFHKAYFFDLREVTRWFNPDVRIGYMPGDVAFPATFPCISKSRPLAQPGNNVILKLDQLRHFMFVNDTLPFRNKKDRAIFRGKIRQSRVHTPFLQKYFHSPLCDCGVVGVNEGCPEEWMKPKKTINEHLEYKFIMTLEGNDVASNLKWVMSSNSVAVMTRPTCETWFMEGQLVPDYHYICVKDDLSDVEQKLRHYIAHPEEAEAIIQHAHKYIAQFLDPERERLISLLVMQKYLQSTCQAVR